MGISIQLIPAGTTSLLIPCSTCGLSSNKMLFPCERTQSHYVLHILSWVLWFYIRNSLVHRTQSCSMWLASQETLAALRVAIHILIKLKVLSLDKLGFKVYFYLLDIDHGLCLKSSCACHLRWLSHLHYAFIVSFNGNYEHSVIPK